MTRNHRNSEVFCDASCQKHHDPESHRRLTSPDPLRWQAVRFGAPELCRKRRQRNADFRGAEAEAFLKVRKGNVSVSAVILDFLP
jgi:hypothetical protein